jgi:acetylornithine deacetylase/succinyl-diaminopimelate desuccinylase-like protein
MDSGVGDYNRLWISNSLRGLCNFDLSIKTLKKGIHSGKGSGIAPETFMILRSLIAKLEDSKTGLLEKFRVEIPESYKNSIAKTADIIGKPKTPLLPGVKFLEEDTVKLLIRNYWEPCLAVTGINGIPSCKEAGNVLRAETEVRISIRIPPTFDCNKGADVINDLLKDTPFNSKVQIKNMILSNGTTVKLPLDKLKESLSKVSTAFFKNDYAEIGIGGSIPFVKILTMQYPNSQVIITGCGNTDSNIHGPNENLNLDYCKKFTSCISYLISDYNNFMD